MAGRFEQFHIDFKILRAAKNLRKIFYWYCDRSSESRQHRGQSGSTPLPRQTGPQRGAGGRGRSYSGPRGYSRCYGRRPPQCIESKSPEDGSWLHQYSVKREISG